MTVESTLVATRRSLHAVAETILAGHQHRVAGTIRLAVGDGGFHTLPMPGSPSLLAVRGTDLVVVSGTTEQRVPLRGSLQELAAAAGVRFGAPDGVYPGGLHASGSDHVAVDAGATRTIMTAFARGDEALRALARRHAPDQPPAPVLWPEHFDVGITLDQVNYGVSPGDDEIPEPYAYVGPFTPRRGPFWNQPFGSARLVRELPDVEALLGYLEDGLVAAATDPAA